MPYSKPELAIAQTALDAICGWKWALFCPDADATCMLLTVAAYDVDE